MKRIVTLRYAAMVLATGLIFITSSCKKEGCMDSKATNFDEKAKKDDGSCVYPNPVSTPTPEPEAEKAETTGLVKIGEATSADAKANLELYAMEDLYPGMNKLYLVVYDSESGKLIKDGHVEFTPMMKMNSGMDHGAPVMNDHEGGADDKGRFSGKVFFVMPSTAGKWMLKTKFHNHANEAMGEVTFEVVVTGNSNRMMASFVDTTTSDSMSIFLSYVVKEKPEVGSNELTIAAYYRKSMMEWPAAEDLTIEFEPSMPSMGHGSPNNENPTHTKKGMYVGKVNYTMTGEWKLDVTVKRGTKVLTNEAFFEYTL